MSFQVCNFPENGTLEENYERFISSGFQFATLSKRDSKSVFSPWILQNISQQTAYIHSVKSGSVSPNKGEYGPESLEIRTLFTQW